MKNDSAGLPPDAQLALNTELMTLPLTVLLKTLSGQMTLSNRAISYIDAYKAADATQHVSGARSAGLAAVFNLSFAVLKGVQLTAKRDARTGTEMMGAVFSSMASILDFRIKAYELTVTKGQAGLNLFQARPMVEMTDNVHAKTLRAMRLTSFKFLLPASIITAFWGWQDASISFERGDAILAVTQAAGVIGTVFTVASALGTLTGPLLGISVKVWSVLVAILGGVGAVLALGSIVLIFLLKDEEWVSWLKDCPLRKGENGQPSSRKPVHDNLQETLESLAAAKASV